MYEPHAHTLLIKLIEGLDLDRPFLARLAAHFHRVYGLMRQLYGRRPGLEGHLRALIAVMHARYQARPAHLRALDAAREADPAWLLSPQWVGMSLYVDRFAGDLDGLISKLPYLDELGVNLVHLMPLQVCPEGARDGGYAVSDFKSVEPRLGGLDALRRVAAALRKRGSLLMLDVVINHTSDEHAWAQAARAGEAPYTGYYYTYPDRDVPDQLEATMPEVFPETAPGSFTWDEAMSRWVMTVFHRYQWDLNYTQPRVLIEMLDVLLFWANEGADVLRLDAVAFLWKRLGTSGQSLPEAHDILRLLRACSQVVAPGVQLLAEAIVAPEDIVRYFGGGPEIDPECEIAYHATLMALLWDGIATRNAKVLNQALARLPQTPSGTTWVTYARCHDDIGLGFSDEDIARAGYDPAAHRRFLLDYYTGVYDGVARGALFGLNPRTGDARISGTLASLVGLGAAIARGDEAAITQAIDRVLLLHGVIFAFGGVPMLFYGDEIGALNDLGFQADPNEAHDSRWMHRPRINWSRVEWRALPGTVERRIFSGLRRLIQARKATPAFDDGGARRIIAVDNPHLLVFARSAPATGPQQAAWVVANFDTEPQLLDLTAIPALRGGPLVDLARGGALSRMGGRLLIPALGFYWLTRTTLSAGQHAFD
ncbi:alpha-amylase [Myxococcota bacterium]|nr:alpha-amylase [Myxococcota bacterium]MBU1433284.1 alpha-amylase [Myxococcota bacterium]MBU1899008.1 alpha-amylase [Myxococcota bacterium]